MTAQMESSRRRFLLAAASLASAAVMGRAQAPAGDEEPTFTAGVKVVNVLASVRDKKGEFIRDLTKDDFEISEDGRPQAIKYFARQSDLPLTVGLMVDTSMSQVKVLDQERGASFRFIDQVLRERKDKFFIVQFDMSVRMRQDLTDSRKQLDDALSYVDTPTRAQLQTIGSGAGTLLYDALVKTANETMKPLRGRKAVIVMTDGVDIGSEQTASAAIDAAQKADTLIYSILFSDSGAYGFFGGGDGRSVLQRMSHETGGGFYAVTKKQSIEQIFDQIQDELRSQYNLGYVSDKPVQISEFRKIDVRVKQKGLTVQARDRYWARP